MKWDNGTENPKRNARIAKKVAKYRRERRGYFEVLGVALYSPQLSREKVRVLKVEARKLAWMRHTRIIFEHLAIHKRLGYDAIKIRTLEPTVGKVLRSKLVHRRDVEFWKTQFTVVEVVGL